MHRTRKIIAVCLFTAIAVSATLPTAASTPEMTAPEFWAALWQPLAELLGFVGTDQKANGLGNVAGAAGGAWEPHSQTEAFSGNEGDDVSLFGPIETTEEGGALDPNGLTSSTEEGAKIDPNG